MVSWYQSEVQSAAEILVDFEAANTGRKAKSADVVQFPRVSKGCQAWKMTAEPVSDSLPESSDTRRQDCLQELCHVKLEILMHVPWKLLQEQVDG